MNRDELLELRQRLLTRTAERRKLGDFDTNAADIRLALEAVTALASHLVDRMKPRE